MTRKLFALLALVGLAAAPSTGWAADFRATLHVVASPSGGGSVTVSDDGYQHGGTSLDSSKTWTFNVTATANQDWSFAGWFENSNCEGDPISTSANYNYAIKVGTKDYDSKEGKIIPSWYAKERTLYAKFAQHTHAFAYSIDGNKITKSCTAEGCPGGVGGTATLTANGATYDGKSHAATATTTGDVTASLSYNTTDGQAPTVAGTYEVTMKVDGGTAENSTLTKSFTIAPAEINSVSFSPASQNYDGTAKSSTMTVKAGNLTLNAGEYKITAGTTSGVVGSPAQDTVTTVTVESNSGNFTGSKSGTWIVKAPTGALGKMTPSKGCEVDPENANNVVVAESRELDYDPNTGKWSVGINVGVPSSNVGGITDPTVTFPDDFYVTATPQEAIKVTKNSKYNDGASRKYYYMTSVDAVASFSKEDIEAAAASSGKLVFAVEIWAKAGQYNEKGVKATTYTMTVLIDEKNPMLNDEYGNQVYPHVDFVAENGTTHLKYLTLGAALGVATNDQTVTLIDNAEEGAFEIGPGVTLDLVGFGNENATYKLARSETAEATLRSTKAEKVSTINGYEVVTDTETEPGVYIYTAELAHQHAWTFEVAEDGITLVASCADPDTCTIAGGKLTMQLQGVADKTYDGKGISPSVVDIDVGGNKFREVIEGVTVGEITYEKPSYSTEKWYTGAYTASCVVTIDEVPYTLTKGFNILPKEYTDGFVASVGGLSVRFDTLLEATTVANEGDTIYYKGGDLTGNADKEAIFSSQKNITLDLGGASVKRDEWTTVTIKNSGAGTVTLTNGTIVQPKSSSAGQINIKGNFAFADIETKNRADRGENFLKLTVKSGTLTVLGGKYTSQFVADGGTVICQGGKFWDGKYNSHAYFSQPTPAEGYVVIPGTGSMTDGNGDNRGFAWEVVAHTHDIVYSASDNIITAACGADDHEYCGYGSETLTLTAVDRQETGSAYEGAQIEYSTKFPVKDAVIEYWVKNGEKLEGAPSAVGFYEARVTVGEATAVAPFEITHIHEFELNVVDGTNVTARCTVSGGSCDYQEAKTVTLNAADTKTFDGAAYEATSTKEAGFPSEDFVTVAIEYWVKNGDKLESAPSDVGAYTVKMVVTSSRTAAPIVADPSGAFGVGYVSAAAEKDFVIVQANLANATIELNKENYAFNGQAQVNGIKTVKLGNYTLVEGTDYTKSGDDFSQVGSPSTDCTYTVTFTPCGNFSGSPVERSWTITTMGTSASFGTPTTINGDYGVIAGNVLTVTAPTKMVYANNAWAIGMNVVVPTSGWDVFTPAALLYFASPKVDGTFAATDDAKMLAAGIVPDTAKISGGKYSEEQYMKSFSWIEAITLKQVEAAIAAGETNIVRTLKAYALKYGPDKYLGLSLNNDGGIRETEYRMEIPLANLVLPVPADQTLEAGDVAIEGFQLQLGKKATVTANAQVTDFAEKIVSDGTAGYAVTESGEGPLYVCTYENAAVSYQITYQFEGNDGKTPTHTNPTTYTVADAITFAAVTLDGYEFKGWNPAKIEAGTTGNQTVIGTFEKIAPPTITITIAKDAGIADVQANDKSVVGELELPADATTVELTLVADGLTIPVYKVITNDVTNVTQRVATHAVVEGLTYTFIAEEAKADDPGVSDADVKEAIIAAVDPGESHDAAVANIEAVIGGDEPKVAPKELATWITDNGIKSVDIAASDYLAASVKLDTPKPITDATEVNVETFENASAEGFELSIAIKIDSEATPEVVKAAKEKVVGYIQAVEELGNEFAPVDAERVTIDTATGKVTITPAEGKTSEFFKIVIPKDK